jgi:hypothetical protein
MSDAGRAATEAVLTEERHAARRGRPPTLATVDRLIDEAAAARPELAEQARRYRDSRLALVLPRYRSPLSS